MIPVENLSAAMTFVSLDSPLRTMHSGHKRKWRSLNGMSVLPSRADIVN